MIYYGPIRLRWELWMSPEGIEKHLLSGLDQRQRGFSRQIEIEPEEAGYRASLQYEQLLVRSESRSTKEEALLELVQNLHENGYRQLRSRLNFRGGSYLGSMEPWLEYTDPQEPLHDRKFFEGLWRFWQRVFYRER
jgi:hypothetical protein